MITGVIFCDSDNFVARSIKDITNEDESHVALLFGDTVLHYRFLGFESMHIAEFEQIYKISAVLSPPKEIMISEQSVIKANKGGAYDFLGILYVAFFLFMRDFFGITMPGGNYWQNKRDKFCVEFAAEICLGDRGSMMTPGKFKNKLLVRGWNSCKISV
jgi:hypothetical protein